MFVNFFYPFLHYCIYCFILLWFIVLFVTLLLIYRSTKTIFILLLIMIAVEENWKYWEGSGQRLKRCESKHSCYSILRTFLFSFLFFHYFLFFDFISSYPPFYFHFLTLLFTFESFFFFSLIITIFIFIFRPRRIRNFCPTKISNCPKK